MAKFEGDYLALVTPIYMMSTLEHLPSSERQILMMDSCLFLELLYLVVFICHVIGPTRLMRPPCLLSLFCQLILSFNNTDITLPGKKREAKFVF